MERQRVTNILVMRKAIIMEIPVLDITQSKAEEEELSDTLLKVLFEACVEKKRGGRELDRKQHFIKMHLHVYFCWSN